MEKITKVSQIEKYKDYPLKDIVENLEIDIYWIKPKYPELYEKIKEFRKTYKKCISCKKYFLPENKETFCKNQKCQEFKKERSTKIKQKARNTNLEKYGVEYYVNIDKRKKTNLEKYGEEYYFNRNLIKEIQNKKTNEEKQERIKKIKDTKLKKYGYEYFDFEAIKQTNLEKFGVDNIFKNPEYIKTKTFEKFGVSNISQLPEVRNKVATTNIQKYGAISPLGSDRIKEKIKQTNLLKYGVENAFQNPEIQDKIKQTNILRYGFESVLQNPGIQDKVRQTNILKYGVENALQNPEIQDKIKQSNKPEYTNIEDIPKEKVLEFIKSEFPEYLNFHVSQKHIKNYQNYNIDYVRNNFIKDGRFLAKDFRDYYGLSASYVTVYKKQNDIEEPSKVIFGEAEDKFYSCLQENIKTKIYRQYKIFNKFTDFYFILNDTIVLNKIILNKNEKIVIEYLGDLHHGYSNDETMTYLHKTASQLYKETFERFKFLLSHNDVDRVLYAWHSEFISSNIKALKEYKYS